MVNYLGTEELTTFSHVARACYSVTARKRFRQINVRVASFSSLFSSIRRLENGLDRAHSILRKLCNPDNQSNNPYTYVQRMEIFGSMFYGSQILETTRTLSPGFFDPVPRFPQEFRHCHHRRGPVQWYSDWWPLTSFISKLTLLEDVVYACSEQVPRYLLETLHTSLPDCRLHVHTFSLRSLYQSIYHVPSLYGIDEHELLIATSTSLTSVAAMASDFVSDKIGYNEEALLAMVAGIAPNLKHVYFSESPWSVQGPHPKFPWPGLDANHRQLQDQNPARRGKLESLTFVSPVLMGNMTRGRLAAWRNCSDFSVLGSLGLFLATLPEVIHDLAQMACSGELKSLQSFGVEVDVGNYREVVPGEVDMNLGILLSCLEPLTDLVLVGYFAGAALDAVLSRHAGSLRNLTMRPGIVLPRFSSLTVPFFIPHDRMTESPQRFFNLQVIELSINRTQGDKREVAFYRALGAMPQLEKVTLFLDCSCYRGPDAEPKDHADTEVPPEVMRKTLINSAIDEKLARSIYHLIFPRTPSSSVKQAKLSLEPMGILNYNEHRAFSHPQTLYLGIQLAHRWDLWLLEDGTIGIKDEEVDLVAGPTGQFGWVWLQEFAEVWEQLWPGTSRDGWRTGWTSLPLEV